MNIFNCCYSGERVHEGPPTLRRQKQKISPTDEKIKNVRDAIDGKVVEEAVVNVDQVFKEIQEA